MTQTTDKGREQIVYGKSIDNKDGTSLIDTKYQKPNHCDDCGKKMSLSKKLLEYQKKHKNHFYVRVSCGECIEKARTLTDIELGLVKKVEVN